MTDSDPAAGSHSDPSLLTDAVEYTQKPSAQSEGTYNISVQDAASVH